MKFRKHIGFLLAIFLLVSNTGFAIDVHYCGGNVASVKPIFWKTSETLGKEEKGCCPPKVSTSVNKKDSCCKNKVVHFQKKLGKVTLRLPTGSIQKKLMENTQMSVPEVNTILLAGCITSIDGEMSIGNAGPLALGMSDRAKIIDSILERNPGPRLGEVSKVCKACEEKIEIPLSLVDLFRL